jgi:hypothetical protein
LVSVPKVINFKTTSFIIEKVSSKFVISSSYLTNPTKKDSFKTKEFIFLIIASISKNALLLQHILTTQL